MNSKSLSQLAARVGAPGAVVVRYLATSAINVVNHQLLLQLAVRWWGWGGGAANTFAALVAVVPAYLLSRYWVWQVKGKPSLRDEVIPFWIIAAIGLVASTAAAELADRAFDEPIMISVGSLFGYLLVWVLKFVVLNYLFRRSAEKQTDLSPV
ncbi:MAG: GtrA family protein [Acidimicrobiales bacterium]